MQEFFTFQLRPNVLYKPGLVRELGDEVQHLGGTRALIVTDAGMVSSGLLERTIQGLGNAVEIVGVFDNVPANSAVTSVEEATVMAKACDADVLVALGGGSALDTAKAMRILMREGGSLLDHQGYNVLSRALPLMVAIPTTAGTGSEVTPFAVIRDEASQSKLTFSSPYLAPDLAILDPEMTTSLPARLTAATGMDALCHAIEAFVSSQWNVISDALALQAIDTISNNLREATHNGDDLHARGQMLIAACIAGMAFGSALLGAVHALAHSIGGFYQVHHGTANAILLPHVMRFNSTVVPNRYSRIARAMGVNAGGRPEEKVIADGINAVSSLSADCGLPLRLRDVDVPEDALETIATVAATDGANYTNPRPADEQDLLEILRAAW